MADFNKGNNFDEKTESDKAALGRKLLNRHQKSKGSKKSGKETGNEITNTDVSNVNINDSDVNQPHMNYFQPPLSTTPIQNYFSVVDSSSFFDSVPSNNATVNFNTFPESLPTVNTIETSNVSSVPNSSSITELNTSHDTLPTIDFYAPSNLVQETCNTNSLSSKLIINNVINTADDISMEDPEINPNEIFDLQAAKSHLITTDDANKLIDFLGHHDSETKIQNDPPLSTADNLRQISTHLDQLMDSNINYNSSNEGINQELKAALDSETNVVNHLKQKNNDYEHKIAYLEQQIKQEKFEYEKRYQMALEPLQNQLQCHAQRVGILVGEKTELSALLSQCEVSVKQKTIDNEELQGRLRTSKSRVTDIERELNKLRQESIALKSDQNETVMLELKKVQKEKDHALQDSSEIKEKLNNSEVENYQLKQSINEARAQLDMANIKIQQLTLTGNSSSNTEVEMLTQKNLLLEKQIADMNLLLTTVNSERDQSSSQYQQYTVQLTAQITSLAEELKSLTIQNENLFAREQSLVNQISEMERIIQKLPHEKPSEKSPVVDMTETNKQLQALQEEQSKMDERITGLVSERDELLKELVVKKENIAQLEEKLEQCKVDQPDSAKLLASIESDKVAASRAVHQNLELKAQLEEMQEAFVKMTNDKAELANQLTSEQFKTREMHEKIGNVENQLETLVEAVKIKDNELTEIRNRNEALQKQEIQVDQLNDRLRHYEAHDHSAGSLQSELQQAITTVDLLTKENLQLKKELTEHNHNHHQHDHDHDNHHDDHDHEHDHHNHTEEEIDKEDALQSEIFQLKQTIDELESINKELSLCDDIGDDTNCISKATATKQLEAKFTKTMEDIANLEDEKQRLEHLVLQLQHETETIGEYVTLYQQQRAALTQRAMEKEDQLRQLGADRQQMKVKLQQLNNLITKLMVENGNLGSDVIEQQRKLNEEVLCEEHSRERNDTQTITENSSAKTEIAGQIMELLTEMKSSSLVQETDISGGAFHSCSWCSGKLITV